MRVPSEFVVGTTYHVIGAMNGRPQEWVVDAVGTSEVKLAGVWFRQSQVRKWIRQGQLVNTKRESAKEQGHAEHQ